MVDYSFIDCHIAKENIGTHDFDNRFVAEPMARQIEYWQEEHPGCTIIGMCYDEETKKYGGYYPMVYEDENGFRYYTHWDVKTYLEYKEEGLL